MSGNNGMLITVATIITITYIGIVQSMLLSKPTTILWDVDGTLSDSFLLGFESTQKILMNNGKSSISEEMYHQGTKYTTPRRLAWHVTGNPDDPVGETLGRQFDELYVQLVSPETAPLYPGIKELLVLLNNKKIKQGALSNACGSYVQAVLLSNHVNNMFSVQYGADDVPAAKPSGLGLLKCCQEISSDPAESIYVGDSPSDGEAAKNAGMVSIGVTYGSHPKEAVRKAFTHSVDTVEELKDLLLYKIL